VSKDNTPELCLGGLTEFLDALRAFESGIDPNRFAFYLEQYDRPTLDYFEVERPGRARREWMSGDLRIRRMTVREYFAALGVEACFDRTDPNSLRRMQYRSLNPLGFVGYQFGEAILIATAYYEPETVTVEHEGRRIECPRYYAAALQSNDWRAGCVEKPVLGVTGDLVVTTDTNRWEGRFTGKHGIQCLEDLMRPERQEVVIRDTLAFNFRCVTRALSEQGRDLNELLRVGPSPRSAHETRPKPRTLSGVLAATHLCGQQGVLRMLVTEEPTADEWGTSAVEYLDRFSGYEVCELPEDVAPDRTTLG
jgi:hypothetical protein